MRPAKKPKRALDSSLFTTSLLINSGKRGQTQKPTRPRPAHPITKPTRYSSLLAKPTKPTRPPTPTTPIIKPTRYSSLLAKPTKPTVPRPDHPDYQAHPLFKPAAPSFV